MSAKKRKSGGPMSAAGLVSFYEEFEARIKLSPLAVLILALSVILFVGALHLFL